MKRKRNRQGKRDWGKWILMGKNLNRQERQAIISAIQRDLITIAKESFPKQCSCGRSYANLDEFIAGTQSVEDGRGLFIDEDYASGSVVDLLRNCACGSTLMVAFETRRDHSPSGDKCRTIFGRLHEFFTGCGLDGKVVRNELLRTSQGENSPVLETAFAEHDMDGMERDFIRLQIRALRILMKK